MQSGEILKVLYSDGLWHIFYYAFFYAFSRKIPRFLSKLFANFSAAVFFA